MFNIVFSSEYEIAPQFLVKLRRSAGLSQQDLATILERAQSHVYRMETRQRPIELVEFCRIASATGHHPTQALAALLAEWAAIGCDYHSQTGSTPTAMASG